MFLVRSIFRIKIKAGVSPTPVTGQTIAVKLTNDTYVVTTDKIEQEANGILQKVGSLGLMKIN